MYRSPVVQPAKAVLVLANISIRDAAKAMPSGGVNPQFLGRVLNGYVPPTPRIIRGLEELTGKSVGELFPDFAAEHEAVAS